MVNDSKYENCGLCGALDTFNNVPVCNGGMIWPEGIPENPPCYEQPEELSRRVFRLVKGAHDDDR